MSRSIEKVNRELKPLAAREVRWWTWKRVLVAAVIVLVILEIGTYAFNWTWTGFKNNDSVWAYLQLLLEPIALAALPVWFMAEEAQQRVWLAQLKIVFVVAVAILVVLLIGSYTFNWTWTGFKEHGNLWDWLGLFLVPLIVAILPIWYSLHHGQMSDKPNVPQPPPSAPTYQQDWPPPPPVQPPQHVRPAPQE